jgi:hypothetical protein
MFFDLFKSRRRYQNPRFFAKVRLWLEELETRALPSVSVLTYHNDNASTGQNLGETILTPANLNATNFGKLFTTMVDGNVYAQPLYVPGLSIPFMGTHNVVFVATEHDSLYAIDANNGGWLWRDGFLSSGLPGATVTTVPSADVGAGDNIAPEIGITATPVIDPATNILYVEAKSKEVVSGVTHYVQRLHAVNIADGSEALGGPALIADTIFDGGNYTYVSGPTVDGTGDGSAAGRITFNALRQLVRPALTLVNGTVYVGSGSHGDNGPYHGWVLGYRASDLSLTAAFNTTPNGGGGGIWQSSGKLAVDAQGDLYFETGNGTFDRTLGADGLPVNGDYGDSFLRLTVDPNSSDGHQNGNPNGFGLKVADYFTPFNEDALNRVDLDLGSGAPLLLPDSAGSADHPHLLVGAGKEGKIYLIDRDHMGGFSPSGDNVVQSIPDAISGSFDTPAFFNGMLFYTGGSNTGGPNDFAKAFTIAGGVLSSTPTSRSPDIFSWPGATPSISANGTADAIVWALDRGTNQLRAYNATNLAIELYTTAQVESRDRPGAVVKFTVPTVADGQVFIGTSNAVVAYGQIPPETAPPAAPSNLVASAWSAGVINLTWNDNSNNEDGFQIEESSDGVNFRQIATTGPNTTAQASFLVGGLQPATTYAFRVRAFNSRGESDFSNTASATTISGTGGLDFSSGFDNVSGLLAVNGVSLVDGARLQLVGGDSNEAGSVFSTTAVQVTGFSTQFTFQVQPGFDPPPLGDGLTFTIQSVDPTAIGRPARGLGYGAQDSGGPGGISNSAAVKFDFNDAGSSSSNSTGLFTGGEAPFGAGSVDLTGTGIDFTSGDVFQVAMTYDGTTLQVTITDTLTGASAARSYAVNILQVVGSDTAFVGFTAGTAFPGQTSVVDVLTWTYTPTAGAAPAAPSGLTATGLDGPQVGLSWTNNSNAVTGFLIDRATDADFAHDLMTFPAPSSPPGTVTFVDTTVVAGTTYFYRVRAVNAAGSSANSNAARVDIPTPPATPSGAHATLVTATEVDLAWQNNATNADFIRIKRKRGTDGTFEVVAPRLPPDVTSFQDTGLSPGTFYDYHIEAVNIAGPSDFAGVTVTTVPPAPTGLTATAGFGQVLLTWNASPGAITYTIYRGTVGDLGSLVPIQTGVTSTSFTDTGLDHGATYFYAVKALNPASASPPNPDGESVFSDLVSATVL